ncbi:hypothetical protein SAMN05421774_104103 [Gemmobacter megaterium]|uniref:Uncharacterized protein n=1 Tax=Gemmobacter megaterium TaxID=1086013 RepID=A0A1N7NS96_9RHOB|nr:hypothetical protein [Gemmobacter megaterium]GGE16851.1 hypothetical protein GCM10011345_23490 [Gemmobacter megaterium]SIT01243.1 hypothetical protein SAMN05421774_104103 [Gemmobacter megaterium]
MSIPMIRAAVQAPKPDTDAIEAAAASLAYWTAPVAANIPARPQRDLSPLEQMYAYFD